MDCPILDTTKIAFLDAEAKIYLNKHFIAQV